MSRSRSACMVVVWCLTVGMFGQTEGASARSPAETVEDIARNFCTDKSIRNQKYELCMALDVCSRNWKTMNQANSNDRTKSSDEIKRYFEDVINPYMSRCRLEACSEFADQCQ